MEKAVDTAKILDIGAQLITVYELVLRCFTPENSKLQMDLAKVEQVCT